MANDLVTPTPGQRADRKRPSFVRRHKALVALLVMALMATAALAGWWFMLDRSLREVPRFERPTQHPAGVKPLPGKGINILLAGVDNDNAAGDLQSMVDSGDWQAGVFRSDTIMVLHINADRRAAQVVSIPRDTWVAIPDHGEAKINAAFSYGGPALLATTVEQFTGIYLDHVMVVDLAGFEEITRTIGGVTVYVPQTVTDTFHNKTWTAGNHVVEGAEALLYVRQRAGLPGGDFDRIQRQQNFLRAVLTKVRSTGTVANPVTLTRLVGDLAGAVAVDDRFSPGVMRDLALGSRRISESDVRFATVPVTGTPTINGQSTVAVDRGETQFLFAALAKDQFEAYLAGADVTLLPSQEQVN